MVNVGVADVALALHNPTTSLDRQRLCVLAAEDDAAFQAYQSTHTKNREATLRNRRLLASFVPHGDDKFSFVGLFERELGGLCTARGLQDDADFERMLVKIGSDTTSSSVWSEFEGRARFLLSPHDALAELKGRLVVSAPKARNYMRLAENTCLIIESILETPKIVPPMPRWDELSLTAQELRQLPQDWIANLKAWRGIYLIVDESDGQRYVGAAYGQDNLHGRWLEHTAGQQGITKELSQRRTGNFRFSILEVLSPVADVNEVTKREQNWMVRLGTVGYGLNS
jgi:hypothetical protein